MRFTKLLAVLILGTGTACAAVGCNDEGGDNSGSSYENTSDGEVREGVDQSYKMAVSESFDEVINGAKITLNCDARVGGVVGTVQNKAAVAIEKVTIDISLSNGLKLETVTFENLQPGESKSVEILAENGLFNRWTADVKVSGNAEAIPDPVDNGDDDKNDDGNGGDAAGGEDASAGGNSEDGNSSGGGLN